jgi:hypothetical protein
MSKITPELGVALLSLARSKHGDLPLLEGGYQDSITNGIVLSVNPKDTEAKRFVNKTVYFRMFKGDCEVGEVQGGHKLVLLETKDILGSS